MKLYCTLAFLTALVCGRCSAQSPTGIPYLHKQGDATQLMVKGKPFLALAGELGNNTASSLENMQPFWSRLVAGNVNCVLATVSWAQVEPVEGTYDFAVVDGLIQEARRNSLKLVFLWFASWKNGLSSYAPYWVKADYKRFPRIQVQGGKSIELLSTFGTATRDADAKAFRALMRHIKSVDEHQSTVLMMQVENEVGVLRDSRDRSTAANQAFKGQVPKELMDYLRKNQATLAPELKQLLAENRNKASGTWEDVFGPGKPDSVEMPIQTTAPPMSREEHDTAWKKLHWASDEVFMAWNYARYVEKVVAEGKAEYPIPMFVNAWLQQPNMAWPGTYPSGGPLPQVNDIWRAGAPSISLLAPDLYLQYFDDTCERYVRNGNPLFIPETNASGVNAITAFVKYGAIGYSPFMIERRVAPDNELALAYAQIARLAPAIAAQQGKNRMAALKLNPGDAPAKVSLGDYTLTLTGMGRGRIPIAPEPTAAAAGRGGAAPVAALAVAPPAVTAAPAAPQAVPGGGRGGAAPQTPGGGRGAPGGMAGFGFNEPPANSPGVAIFIAAGPNEYYMSGGSGNIRVAFAPNTPGAPIVGLGDVQEGRFVDGRWTVVRQLGGDDTGQGEILTLRPNALMRVTVYRYE
jgi:hypothetical protein